MNDQESFAKLVHALEPWRAHLIFVGGWCHRLHALHQHANKRNQEYLFTRDSDLLFSQDMPSQVDIRSALTANGFVEQLQGNHRPPAAHYSLGAEDEGFYAEFLTPLIGSADKRDGTPDATATIAGVSAQKVRYLDILQPDPWVVTLGPQSDFPVAQPMDLLVASPLRFMVQKFLIKESRTPDKQAQDLLYVYETLQLFSNCFDLFNREWHERVAPSMHAGWARRIQTLWEQSFTSSDDLLVTASRMAPARTPPISAKQMSIVLKLGYNKIFAQIN